MGTVIAFFLVMWVVLLAARVYYKHRETPLTPVRIMTPNEGPIRRLSQKLRRIMDAYGETVALELNHSAETLEIWSTANTVFRNEGGIEPRAEALRHMITSLSDLADLPPTRQAQLKSLAKELIGLEELCSSISSQVAGKPGKRILSVELELAGEVAQNLLGYLDIEKDRLWRLVMSDDHQLV